MAVRKGTSLVVHGARMVQILGPRKKARQDGFSVSCRRAWVTAGGLAGLP